MKLILTRHGETIENVKKIIQGHLPGKLTKTGIKQGEKLAKRLAKEKIDFIYSSDLARAVDTAKLIHKYHPKIPIVFIEVLREMFPGDLQGKTTNKYNPKNLPKNAETLNIVHRRANRFIKSLLKKHKKDTVLFVCHGGIGHAIFCAITKKSWKNINKYDLKNTSVSIFDIKEDKNHEVHIYNCCSHLD